MDHTVSLSCPAKVNLALSVGSPAADGYHPIASWMVAVDLCDHLIVQRVDDQSRYAIGWADDAPRPTAIDWPIDSDLIVKAHRLVEQHAGRPLPIRARLTKRIPVGAGLAGGSTDGAAMLKALRHLFDLDLDDRTLAGLSMRIGSDLAFFFSSGSAIVSGRGESLSESPIDRPVHLCLILPGFGCPTGAVYRAFDERTPKASVDVAAVRRCVDERPIRPFNDLAAAACRVQPRLAAHRSEIADLTARPVHITGSGAGMFIVAEDAADAAALAGRVASAAGMTTRAARTTNCPRPAGEETG